MKKKVLFSNSESAGRYYHIICIDLKLNDQCCKSKQITKADTLQCSGVIKMYFSLDTGDP